MKKSAKSKNNEADTAADDDDTSSVQESVPLPIPKQRMLTKVATNWNNATTTTKVLAILSICTSIATRFPNKLTAVLEQICACECNC